MVEQLGNVSFTLNEADKNKDVRITLMGFTWDSKVYVNGKFVDIIQGL